MKYLLMLSLSVCLFLNTNGQDKASLLQGTWKIKSFNYNGQRTLSENHPTIKYKSYTPTHFTLTEIDTATGLVTTSFLGTYKIADSLYSETILNITKESAFMMGKTFSYKLTFDGQDKLTVIGVFNGINSTEVWEKVTSKMTVETLLKPKPLLVLQNGPEQIILKNIYEKIENPVSIIGQENIASIEVLKDATAIELYGASGNSGVIVITVLETERANVIKKLKAAGFID
ncbi:MAG TPA: hypothetical protein VF679_09995 [Pedobacter sp.]|jgi:TonB-dependent SusC/RagA subfamily outer membrane receptor